MTRHQYDASGLAPDGTPTRQLAAPTTRFRLEDGTLWSHAAVLGSFVYHDGEAFSLTPDMMASFVKNFAEGNPAKVPVDYEHSSTSMNPEVVRARAAGDAPAAGDVEELRAVISAADLPPTAVDQLSAAGMQPEDGAGLWMRWRPTARALSRVEAREMKELSIDYADDYTSRLTGERVGPAIRAVALCVRPYLEQMVSVAASDDATHTHRRADDPPPADDARENASTTAGGDARHSQRGTMSKLFSLTSAASGRPVTNEAEAEDALRELTANASTMRTDAEMGRALGAVIPGPTAEAKIAAFKALTAEVETARATASEARTRELGAVADGILAKHTDRIVPARRDRYRARLLTELSAGTEPGKTETEQDIADLAPHGLTAQTSGGDAGVSLDDDKRFALAVEDAKKDPSVVALSAHDPNGAQLRAIDLARRALSA